MKYIFLFTLGLFFFSSFRAQPNSNEWNEMAIFGGGERERAVSFSIGLKGYIATGQDSANIVHNDLWEYEPASNTWTQKASIPAVGRRNAAGFSINGKGYVGTGIDSPFGVGSGGNILSDFWEYNPQTNSWIPRASYPGNFGQGIYFSTSFSVDTKGYICCGKEAPSNYSNKTYEYNPSTNSWFQKSNFPGGVRYALTSFSIGSKAYVGTGTDEDIMRKDFYAFTPSSNSWVQIADMPISGRSACSTFSINNQGFVIFGTDGGFKDELWEYHVSFNMWFSRSAFPSSPRKGGIAFSVGNKGYAGIGKGNVGGLKKNFYEYTPAFPVGIDDLSDIVQLNIYPNPITDYVNFSFQQYANYEILIFNIGGQLIKKLNLTENNTMKVNFSNVPEGLYIYQIKVNNLIKPITGKLVVKK